MVGAISVFGASLAGIVALLLLKAVEQKRDHVFAPRLRLYLDRIASALKSRLEKGEDILSRLPSLISLVLLKLLAGISVHLAQLARSTSESAYRLADFISHKHNFERRETRSEFLKTVIEHKNGLAQPIIQKAKKQRVRKQRVTESITPPIPPHSSEVQRE